MKTLKKRRKENKTDYLVRLKLLKSEKPRLICRKTNKYIIAQYVLSNEAKDIVLFGLTSKELLKFGWPEKFKGSLKSIPASYLIGYLMAKKILKEKKKIPLLDFGMQRTLHKTKLFSFIKGVVDGGVKIDCSKDSFPEEKRIEGKDMKEDFTKTFKEVKSKIEK